MPGSLTLSASVSGSKGEVECKLFVACGERCRIDPNKCDCDAYAADANDDNRYYRELRDRKAIEEHMLDAAQWDKQVSVAGDIDSPSPQRSSQSIQKTAEDKARDILSKIEIAPLPDYTQEDEADDEGCDDGLGTTPGVHDPNERTFVTRKEVMEFMTTNRRQEEQRYEEIGPSLTADTTPSPFMKAVAQPLEVKRED
jgi:hypothetical protein